MITNSSAFDRAREDQARARDIVPRGTFAGPRVALLTAAVAAAAGEAFAAGRSAADTNVRAIFGAGIEAALMTLPAVLVVALVCDLLLTRAVVARFADAVVRSLSAREPDCVGPALLVGAVNVTAASLLSERLGEILVPRLSPRFAVSFTLGAFAVALFVAMTAAASVGPSITRGVLTVVTRFPRLRPAFRASSAGSVLAVIGAALTLRALPGLLSVAPMACFLGLSYGLSAPTASRFGRKVTRLRLLFAALGVMVVAVLALPRVSEDARLVVLTRAPYSSMLVGSARSAVDRDHDGYSPILLGGDCDDRDPKVNPDARDIPGNGIDENCSGADARPLVLPVEPVTPRPASLPPHMNIVLIQLDAQRLDHLGFAGYKRPTSPRLDRFRKTATWFKEAYTPAPTTRFAMSAIFTGLPVPSIVHTMSGATFRLSQDMVTVAERLEGAGYDRVGYTISFVLQHIKDVGQGFRLWDTPYPVTDWAKTYPNAATLTTDASLAYLRGLPPGHSPYFLFSHYRCTHDPYSAKTGWVYGDEPVDKYDSASNYCDEEVGRLLDEIEGRDDKDLTAVIIFSDHGELFGERGLTGHGLTLTQADVHTLLLVHVPGAHVEIVEKAVILTDLAPTMLELAGLAGEHRPGIWSLLRYIFPTGAPPPDRPVIMTTDQRRGPTHYRSQGILDGRFKFIRDLSSGSQEVFDVTRDPNELTNVGPVVPDLRARLAEMLDGAFATTTATK